MGDRPSTRGRLAAPTLALAAALLALALWAALGQAAAGTGEHRADGEPVSAPRQPLGRADAAEPSDRRLRLSRSFLVAGRPGQNLRVLARLRRRDAHSKRLTVVLRRARRVDPRHPGAELGGEREARRRGLSAAGRRLRVRLRGLDPLPGPYRLAVRNPRRTLAATRIDVLPQGRLPLTRKTGARAAEASAPAPSKLRNQIGVEVNQTLKYRPGSQASSAIAVDTDDPSRVIAATNDGDSRPLAMVSSSSLQLGSITSQHLPTATRLPDGSLASITSCCDPAVAADAGGNLWMAVTSVVGAGRILLGRAGPAAHTFGTRATGLPVAPGSSSQQKPALAVADGSTIAAAWVETGSGVQNVVVSLCDLSGGPAACDDPSAWSDPAPITGTSGLYSMPDLDFAPNGDLYAVWWDAGADNAVEIARCPSGSDCGAGASWTEQAAVDELDSFDDDGDSDADPLPLFCPIIGAPGGLVNPSPGVEVGPSGTVFVAFSDLRDNPDPGSPSRCTASGSDKTFDSFVAAGVAPGAFPATNSAVRLSDDGALDVNDHFLPALTVDPSTGVVEAGFYSTTDPSGQFARRMYSASSDLGLTYSDPEPTANADSRFAGSASDGIDYGDRQGVDSAAGVFRPAWTDSRPIQGRDPELYVRAPQIETTITAGPTGTVADPKATFRFSSPAPRTDCSVDGQAFLACKSPYSFGPLTNGSHELRVRSTDSVGNTVDLSYASAEWAVADVTPPETTITNSPKRKVHKKRPVIDFVADVELAKFECRYDREPWERCKPPRRGKVSIGRHKFKVRATDVGGNTDPTAAVAKFRRIEKCRKQKRRKGLC